MKHNKVLFLAMFIMMIMFCIGCSQTGDYEDVYEDEPVTVQTSGDKHIAYAKNYKGQNLANVGYYSLGGELRDEYGNATIKLIVITEDGSYVDLESEDELKNYKVIDQNIEPNTEIKFTFEKDEDGEEYDNLIESSTIDEIAIKVQLLAGSNKYKKVNIPFTMINTNGDKYTRYCKDYVGRNLLCTGYYSLGGDLRDEYGGGTIKLNVIVDDGTYINYDDEELLKQYYVVSQSVAPNTEISFEFDKDSDGNECSNIVDYQSISEIDLRVKKLPK